ncbi:MAG TPA: prolyl oligopeptidase family serine peptidase [Candidatus Saccharimonadales bacterium]|nr:prolyl oligopeptidase family serine peptidase [Candidatus Saccharimonadales bacterium]
MKKIGLYVLIPFIFILIGWFANMAYHLPKSSNPISQIKPTPLLKYSIENLSTATFKPSEIVIGKILKDDLKYTSYEFTMKFSPDFSNNLKSTSGLINIPKGKGPFPAIVMYRGYVDQKLYIIGEGTQPSARVFAQNGFITVAPDFLGYGDSDKEAGDIFESRFQTYVTAATVIKSVSSLKDWDGKNIFIWGHSNGGQVALTTLEITGVNYPTVLWAPVSKPFPYSILVYTDESDDGGKLITHAIADFEDSYDITKFSLSGYLNKIRAPIQLNQGTADTSVPYWWSDDLVKNLKTDGVDISYIKYPGADHNIQPLWSKAVENSLVFFQKHL